jgi:hypothetical protein
MDVSNLRTLLEQLMHDKTTLSFLKNDQKTTGCIATDPGPHQIDGKPTTTDFDDILMLFFIWYAQFGVIYVVLSGGDISPEVRLEFVKHILPNYADAQFGVPLVNDSGSAIVFLQDGSEIPGELDWFANCAPLSAASLNSIAQDIKFGGLVVTVGANTDGTKSGLNQRINGPETDFWDTGFIPKLFAKGVEITNLAAAVSRQVLTPNPLTLPVEFKINQFMKPEALHQAFLTAKKFLTARPPADHPLCLRFNQSNSDVTANMFGPNPAVRTEDPFLADALAKVKVYSADPAVQQAALYPVYRTLKKGGVYVDEKLAVLTPESDAHVLEQMKESEWLPPAYDLLACLVVSLKLAAFGESVKRPIE